MLKASYRGMIIVTGPTGSGKSTTLAAMIGALNRTRYGNIITIEDPVEYVHVRDKCIINQREIGVDVNSFADGVHDALRFVPDVVLIGEIRDAETMKQAVRATESGHLVLASMHAPTPVSAIRKMLAYLSDSQGDMQSLPYLLVSVIAQALVRDKSGSGKNHLASAYLDCTQETVVRAIAESASGADASHQRLATLEKQLVTGEVKSGTAMLTSLKSLIAKQAIDVPSALAVVSNTDEKEELMKLARKGGN
jgi:Tfp pilus assembly pilus retraction ATPase PilT